MDALFAKMSASHEVMSQRSIPSGLVRRTSHGKWGQSKPFVEALVCQLHSNQARTSGSDNTISCDEPSLMYHYEKCELHTENSAPASRASVCRRDGISLERLESILAAKV